MPGPSAALQGSTLELPREHSQPTQPWDEEVLPSLLQITSTTANTGLLKPPGQLPDTWKREVKLE